MPTSTRRVLYCLAVVALVVLAGCAGSGGDSDDVDFANSGDGGSGGPQTSGDGGTADDAKNTDGKRSALQAEGRALIRTGNVTLEVENFEQSQRNVTRIARQQGGFVSDTSAQVHSRGNQTWTTGRLVVRVPKGNFSRAFGDVKAEGEVKQSNSGARDVTGQLVDLNARLKNLRAQRDRLRTLYENANDTEAVLSVEKRLSTVQSDIERLEAKKKSLEQQVAYSTVTVKLNEPRPDPKPQATSEQRSWYETGVVTAFLDSVDGVAVVLRAMVVAGAYLLPYVFVFGTPLVGLFAIWKRFG